MLLIAFSTILTGSRGFTIISFIGIGAASRAITFLDPLSFSSLRRIVLFLYPTKETTRDLEFDRSPTFRVNSPSMLVTIATLVSFTATVANTRGALVSASITLPLIVMRFCWVVFLLS